MLKKIPVVYKNYEFRVDPICLSQASTRFHDMYLPYFNQPGSFDNLQLRINGDSFTPRNIDNFLKLCQNEQSDVQDSEMEQICEIAKMFQAEKIYQTGLDFVQKNIDQYFSVPDNKYSIASGIQYLAIEQKAPNQINVPYQNEPNTQQSYNPIESTPGMSTGGFDEPIGNGSMPTNQLQFNNIQATPIGSGSMNQNWMQNYGMQQESIPTNTCPAPTCSPVQPPVNNGPFRAQNNNEMNAMSNSNQIPMQPMMNPQSSNTNIPMNMQGSNSNMPMGQTFSSNSFYSSMGNIPNGQPIPNNTSQNSFQSTGYIINPQSNVTMNTRNAPSQPIYQPQSPRANVPNIPAQARKSYSIPQNPYRNSATNGSISQESFGSCNQQYQPQAIQTSNQNSSSNNIQKSSDDDNGLENSDKNNNYQKFDENPTDEDIHTHSTTQEKKSKDKKQASVVYQIKVDSPLFGLNKLYFIQDGRILLSAKEKGYHIVIGEGMNVHMSTDTSNHVGRILQHDDMYNNIHVDNQDFILKYIPVPGKFELYTMDLSFRLDGNDLHWKSRDPYMNMRNSGYDWKLAGEYHHNAKKSKKNIVLENQDGQITFIIRKMDDCLYEVECHPSIPHSIAFSIAISDIVGPYFAFDSPMLD